MTILGRTVPSVLVPLLPAVLIAGVWTSWTAAEGAYFPSAWYPSGIAIVVLLAVLLVSEGSRIPQSRPLRMGLGLLAAFVLWSFLSILWGASPGNALEESNRLLVLLAAVVCVAVLPWSERSATVLVVAWALGVAGVMAIDLIGAISAGEEVRGRFIAGRYLGPTGYPNASAAICAMALCPALLLASRRDVRAPFQVGLVALAVFLLEYSLLPQSRAALIGLVVAAMIALALAPDRLRLLGRLLIVGGAAAVAIGPIYDVYSVAVEIYNGSDEQLAPVVDEAGRSIALTVGGAAVAMALLAGLERLIRPHRSVVRGIRLGTAGVTIVVALAGASLAVANANRIYDEVQDRFAGSGSDSIDTGPRISASFTDKRSDYWRVAVDVFADNPAIGAGAGAYGDEYTKRRDQDFTHNKYAHNLVLRALSEMGVVGGVLLTGAIAALIAGLLAAWRRREGGRRTTIVIASAVFGYFLVHASLDWVEQFPALAAPALSLPVVALAVGARHARGAPGGRRPVTIAAVLVLASVAVLSLMSAYLAERYVGRASASWRTDPAGALRDLDRAASLNPLSAQVLVRKGTISVGLRRLTLARQSFREALERQDGWYPHFELALIAAGEGRFRAARAEIRSAQALNPLDPFVLDAQARIRRGQHIDIGAFHRRIATANSERFTTGGN